MNKCLLIISLLFILAQASASTISGIVREKNGAPLAFASVMLKGTTKGTTTNIKGAYNLVVESGSYVLLAQHVGFSSVEKPVRVVREDLQVDFELEIQNFNLQEVIVQAGGEDPAYAIIRKTIEKRELHLTEIKRFQCEVYLKGQLQLRNFPKRFMGKDVDFEDGDTSKKKMIFLSESIAKYSIEEPNQKKVEVISTKLSGKSDGFGFSNPQIISFYENIVSLGRGLNPRGFISPIASNALNFYRYKFEGTFFENGKEVSRIKVIPKRKYEPLFTGYITIVENDWRLQSVQLKLLKDQQLQLLDTLMVEQLYTPAAKNIWVIKSQVIYPSGKLLGFDFFGNFLQVYDKFNLSPVFKKKYFDNTILKFQDSANKKLMPYWDSVRPMPLLKEETRNYIKQDSLEQVRKSPLYLDSLDRKRNKFGLMNVLFTGKDISIQKRKESIHFKPLITSLYYNTVEGGVVVVAPTYTRNFEGRNSLQLNPVIRYGFANQHLNTHLGGRYSFGKKYAQAVTFSGGKEVFQFNNSQPISPFLNSLVSLIAEYNYSKIYEADFFKLGYTAGIGNGFSMGAEFQFQNRKPLENLADLTHWKNYPNRDYTPNYPTEISTSNMPANKASLFTFSVNWRPGSKYMELPNQKISLGSKYPNLGASITQGISGFLGSDVAYTKWRFSISDNLNMKLAGRLNYSIAFAGFLNADKTFIPDYLHYQGNQLFIATSFLNSFQLAPYYIFSNTAKFNASAHVEYHLNGLLTNKIPLFKTLNWFFVTGVSGLHMAPSNNYYETYFGIENIFKVLRIDFVQGYEHSGGRPSGCRFTLPLFSR